MAKWNWGGDRCRVTLISENALWWLKSINKCSTLNLQSIYYVIIPLPLPPGIKLFLCLCTFNFLDNWPKHKSACETGYHLCEPFCTRLCALSSTHWATMQFSIRSEDKSDGSFSNEQSIKIIASITEMCLMTSYCRLIGLKVHILTTVNCIHGLNAGCWFWNAPLVSASYT